MAINDLIIFRRGPSSEWDSVNPVLASGEPGYDTTSNILKIGNGVSPWTSLSGIFASSVFLTDNSVTYSKIQNISSTDCLLGRSSAGSGTIEEIVCTSFGRSLIATADAVAARTAIGLRYATLSEVFGVGTTGSITSGQTTLTVASGTNINNGDFVVGQGIAPGTTVSSGGGTTTITLSRSVNATLVSDPVTFYRSDRTLSPGLIAGSLCRAWVNFNGIGTVSIRASYNVSSITDGGVGIYTINFTTAMPDANYVVDSQVGYSGSNPLARKTNIDSAVYITSSFRIRTGFDYTGFEDQSIVTAAVFR